MRAIVVLPGQGHRVGNVEFLARSADTPRFNLGLITLQPHREGPELHVHKDEDDSFYVLEGELTFIHDGDEVVAGPARSCSSRPASRTRSRTGETPSSGCSTSTLPRASISGSKGANSRASLIEVVEDWLLAR